MSYFIPKNLEGCRDELPQERIAKSKINKKSRSILTSYGYSPLYSSTFERYDFLKDKYGQAEKNFYHVKDESGEDMVLRYDLTVPMLRIISQYPELNLPIRYYQKGTVWRNNRTGTVNLKEFVQISLAIIGADGVFSEAEVIQICADILDSCGVKKYVIRLNNKKIITGFLKSVGFADKDFEELGRAIDKFFYLGEETFLLSLSELGIGEEDAHKIMNFLHLGKGWSKNFQEISDRFADNEEIKEGLVELSELISLLNIIGISRDKYIIDFSATKRLATYTGLLFEINLEDIYLTPTVVSGGRNNELMGMYSDKIIPAVGATISYDRLFTCMKDLGLIKEKYCTAKVLVTIFQEKYISETLSVAKELRNNGIKTAVYCCLSEKLEKQIRYAAAKGITYALIMSPKDIKAKKVIIKDIKNGQDEVVERKKLAVTLKKKLGL